MKKFVYTSLVIFAFPFLVKGQTDTENYIKSSIYQIATQTGVTNQEDKIETVTYFDGLGRPLQTTNVIAGGDKENIVNYFEYDELGMQIKEYLPWASMGLSGDLDFINPSTLKTDLLNFYDTQKYENTNNPYSEVVLEKSPRFRQEEQGAPGDDWSVNPLIGNSHTIKYEYGLNTGGIKQFSVGFFGTDYTEPQLVYDGTYASGVLYITETRDENWISSDGKDGVTQEFKNKAGQLVLKRIIKKLPAGPKKIYEYFDTQYVYDDFGNITYVLSPEASDQILDANSNIVQSALDKFTYQYKYDGRNRVTQKKLPGKDWEYIVYDKLDRPAFTQDANLRLNNYWLFTKYDGLGRTAYTGRITFNSTQSMLQSIMDNQEELYEEVTDIEQNINNQGIFYTNNVTPNANDYQIYSIEYYDTYRHLNGLGVPTSIYSQPTTEDNSVSTTTQGLQTVRKIRVLGTDHWITSFNAYDEKGRIIFTRTKNDFLETQDLLKTKLDFIGKPLESHHSHYRTGFPGVQKFDYFTYDHMGRSLLHTQKIGDEPVQRIAENEYDELGQLKGKLVGGVAVADALQEVDFKYNIRGWMTEINKVDEVFSSTLIPDLFNFKINYNKVDTFLGASDITPLYNGNISQTFWESKNTDDDVRGYTYNYDELNRITEATSAQGTGFSTMGVTNDYDLENLTYDKNGNIKTLKRRGYDDDGLTVDFWDDLSYAYNGNRLIRVSDNLNGGVLEDFGFRDGHTGFEADFEYDDNGNMTRDRNKNITSIEYNHLNLPTRITFNDSDYEQIEYIYDAAGIKLLKRVVEGVGVETEISYVGSFVYKKVFAGAGIETLEFISQPEGYIHAGSIIASGPKGGISYEGFDYVFQYKDHLGNVRLSYGDTNEDGIIDEDTEIIEENNYYPFGLKQKGYNSDILSNGNSTAQKLKYNGKELNDELGLEWYDFDARNYDFAIGRWLNMDVFASNHYDISPYTSVANNPIIFIDPDGRDFILSGKKADVKKYREVLQKLTGNTYEVVDGNLERTSELNTETDDKKSGILSKLVESLIESDTKFEVEVVKNKDDVFIDKFESGEIDIKDISRVGRAGEDIQAALVGHFLEEMFKTPGKGGYENKANRTESNFAEPHEEGLKKELEILQSMNPGLELSGRQETKKINRNPETNSVESITTTFSYGPKSYQIKTRASSPDPGGHIVDPTGDIIRVKKN